MAIRGLTRKLYAPYYVHPKRFLDEIISKNKAMDKHISFAYNLKREALQQHIELLTTQEEQKAVIEREYKKYYDDLMSNQYKYVAPLLETWLYKININVKWYSRIVDYIFEPKISKEIDYFLEKFPDSHNLSNYSDLSKKKSVEFWLTYHYKRLYVKYLLKCLNEFEEPEIQSESLPDSQRLELDKEVIEYKQEIETLNARIIDLESKSEPKSTEIDVFWNKPKVDLIRLLITALDSKFFKDATGMQPTQEKVMSYFGKVLGIDLTNHQTDLSNGLIGTAESNLKIFDLLRKAMQKRLADRQK